jgi:malectin (di-glucose binding ER protein)
LASEAHVRTNGKGESILQADEPLVDSSDPREDLVRRVLSSITFEKSPKLRAFLVYVCRCAIDNQRTAATEQQIGIHVFGRPPGYNPNEDNIVRSQARLLRLKLEHHFANEGKHEPLVITIPKGRYLPSFESREEQVVLQPATPVGMAPGAPAADLIPRSRRPIALLVLTVILGLVIVWLVGMLRSKDIHASTVASRNGGPAASGVNTSGGGAQAGSVPLLDEVRIAAGKTGDPYIDLSGHRWESDEFYVGGAAKPGPKDLFPPVSDPNLFSAIREGTLPDSVQPRSEFGYNIPVPEGVYELRLYFADPIRHSMIDSGQDAENVRHFQVNANGRPLLNGFDVNADVGSAAVDVRAFKDISAAQDGKIHLEFVGSERPFVSAIELTPGTLGKLNPIRVSAHRSDFVDHDGTEWNGDKYYIGGRVSTYTNEGAGVTVPELYSVERFGNFSYAIPVPAGSYTLKLHFMESFFSPSVPGDLCRGTACRVFDVTCNGVVLLKDFDIYQAAGGAFLPAVRTFHHLHPNGQGKLLLSFTPTLNYAEVRAIEVIDEAK